MYIGFKLQLDETADIFGIPDEYERLKKLGKIHLNKNKSNYEKYLEQYVQQKDLDGTQIQNEWFPQIEADIFISHSHIDIDLACGLAGWINEKFGLSCFIDSNVWGYSKELLHKMNDRLSNPRESKSDGYLYDYESCNQVSAHVNTMLSIALQKMIDKVEAVIVLNTDNAVKVCSDTQMEKTYSPWIYSEIICTQLIRKKPLLAYRNYKLEHKEHGGIYESAQYSNLIHISYFVSLKHLNRLNEGDLIKWEKKYLSSLKNYEYALDVLYEFMCPNDVENTKKLSEILGDRVSILQHAYSTQCMEIEGCKGRQYDVDDVLSSCLCCCKKCSR